MEKKTQMITVEEELNAQISIANCKCSDENRIHQLRKVAKELSEISLSGEKSLYEDICQYIQKIEEPNIFVKKSKKLDEKKFYEYADIDKNTWSNIRLNAKGISRESGFKLAIALQLSEKEAETLLEKASIAFDKREYLDKIVLALLRIECYEPMAAAELLEEYGKNELHPFKNIYNIERMKKKISSAEGSDSKAGMI